MTRELTEEQRENQRRRNRERYQREGDRLREEGRTRYARKVAEGVADPRLREVALLLTILRGELMRPGHPGYAMPESRRLGPKPPPPRPALICVHCNKVMKRGGNRGEWGACMPCRRARRLTCRVCARPVGSGGSSPKSCRPQGEATCHPCRRKAKAEAPAKARKKAAPYWTRLGA